MDVTIRRLAPEETGSVVQLALRAWTPVFDSMLHVLGARIFQHLFGPDWRDHQAADVRRACEDYDAFVAVAKREVLGFTAIDLPQDDSRGEIYMVAVDPPYQRCGIGLQLTEFGIERIRQAGKQMVVVGTGGDPGHAAARATYARAGFTRFPSEQYYLML